MTTCSEYVYPEKGQPLRRRVLTFSFPRTCPMCGSPEVGDQSYGGAKYTCGGEYSIKSQIQNHTEKWWGLCPIKQEVARQEHGRECQNCGEKRLEGVGFPLSFGWTCGNCQYRNLYTDERIAEIEAAEQEGD